MASTNLDEASVLAEGLKTLTIGKAERSDSTIACNGCSFDGLVRGKKYYVFETAYLLNLEEETTVEEETTHAPDVDEAEESKKANQQVARLIEHLDGIFTELEIQKKKLKSFLSGKRLHLH